jgi:peptide/nickel transport system permease protein
VPLGRYLLKRSTNYLVMLFLATSFTYFLAGISLDPRQNFDITNPRLDWDSINAQLTTANINPETPIFERYWNWLTGVLLHWDWGMTFSGGSVNEQIAGRVWVSMRLVTPGFLIGVTLGILLGAWAATRQYKASDNAFTLWSLITISTPTAVIAITLQILATKFNRATGWEWFEFLGETGERGDSWFSGFTDRLQHLLLPTITLSIIGVATYSRYQRSLMLDTLNADYVRTARAKGLPRRNALFRHALRTAMIPTATLFAFGITAVFVGATFTETLFGWHGMGEYLITSLTKNDTNSVVAVTAFAAVTYFIGAMLSEIMVVALDPRVRVS